MLLQEDTSSFQKTDDGKKKTDCIDGTEACGKEASLKVMYSSIIMD